MDVPYETLGTDKVVISLKDFEMMLDLITYDQAKAKQEESFPLEMTMRLIEGENRLKAFRKYRNMSQITLSKKSGIGQGLISEIETGKKNGSITTLKALAHVLEIDLDDLA